MRKQIVRIAIGPLLAIGSVIVYLLLMLGVWLFASLAAAFIASKAHCSPSRYLSHAQQRAVLFVALAISCTWSHATAVQVWEGEFRIAASAICLAVVSWTLTALLCRVWRVRPRPHRTVTNEAPIILRHPNPDEPRNRFAGG